MLAPRPARQTSLRLFAVITTLALAALWLSGRPDPPAASAQLLQPFRNFESPQVHPLALTPDGTRLLAVNSPAGTLSVFQLTGGAPALTAEIPVGLEPVSVAARSNREAWVVNWLSDSVSVVDLASGNVVRTLDVGDEPTDVLFAGASREMAFVCVSGARQVKVFDPSNPAAPPQLIEVFGKQPRALASDGSGAQVYVSVFESGNQTTIVPEPIVSGNGGLPPPSPAMAAGLPAAPRTSLIVRFDGSQWVDEAGKSWSQFIPYTLADVDLVVIDAAGQAAAAGQQVRGLGTHLGNMAFDAAASRLLVANLESTNATRFEPNLRGRFQASRVSFLNVAPGALTPDAVRDLNPHVNFGAPDGSDAERAESLALPSDIVSASDGTIYVAATSSARVGVLAPTGVVTNRVAVGQGPTGLALDEERRRLYVLNRFDQTLSVVDTDAKTQVSQVAVGFNPEPPAVRDGRRFMYDANLSAHGTVSCASCHLSGHRDGLAWDLGDPTGAMVTPNFPHHPMKGPMTTQSLRGIIGTEPLHWRGDRRNLSEFNVAFTALLGSPRPLTGPEMLAFEAFVRTLSYPPNPNENLDRTFRNPPVGPSAARGATAFINARLTGLSCNTCHRALPNFESGTDRVVFPGSILGEPQAFKVPQLRGIYQKTGLERSPGEKLSGFGFLHDGSFDTLFNFLRLPVFQGIANDAQRSDIEAFLLSFDSGIAPAVGLQVTVNGENRSTQAVADRLNLLVSQSGPTLSRNCDLIVKGIYGGSPRGFLHTGGGVFRPDSGAEAHVTLQQLLGSVGPGSELTFTGVPAGTGQRRAIDLDGDNVLDGDEPKSTVQLGGRVVDAAGNGIAGVAVRLSGTQTGEALTDADGRYSFGFVAKSGTHTLTPAGAGLSFAPAARTFTNPKWNQTAFFVAPAGPVATDSSQFFVRQHYADFLNREPDAPGLQFWTNQIEECGTNVGCREVRRINVSAAFYLSIEFQSTGFLVYRAYKASFGESAERPLGMPRFEEFFPDTQRLGRHVVVGPGEWQQQLETNKRAFFDGWVQRPEFLAKYGPLMTNRQFVDTLLANAGSQPADIDAGALAADLDAGRRTRAQALRFVAENESFGAREKNRAFVLMQYYGYLRRNPDDAPELTLDFEGYNFWLGKLNQFGGNFIQAEMVKGFIISGEYLGRFGQQ